MSEKKEYIERGALIGYLGGYAFQYKHTAKLIMGAIEKFPAADVEPVVRCKDCVAYAGKERKGGGVMMICRLNKHEASPEHFCSQGRSGAHMERSGSGEKL